MGAEFKYNRVKTFPNTSKKESISIQVASIIMFKVPILYALIGITLMAITDAHNGQNAADTEAVETPTTAIDRAKRLESDRPACVMLMGWCASDSEKLIGRASRRCLRKEASIYCKNACALCARKNGNTEEYEQYIKKYEKNGNTTEAEESGNEAEGNTTEGCRGRGCRGRRGRRGGRGGGRRG